MAELQAVAAVGQIGLAGAWENAFDQVDCHTGQILLSRSDLDSRRRYLNARSALGAMLRKPVVPIVNENDTVATEELCLGDNDVLAGRVANLVDADLLVILTDQPGLMQSDPRLDPLTMLINTAAVDDPQLDRAAGDSIGELGRGGMKTKLRAARVAARCGASTVIASGTDDQVLSRILDGEALGTLLEATGEPINERRQWLAGLNAEASLRIDDGAAAALKQRGGSLLPVGVVEVCGDFQRGDLVACMDSGGVELARGISNYSADEVRLIMGQNSGRIAELVGYGGEDELIHRDNLVLL